MVTKNPGRGVWIASAGGVLRAPGCRPRPGRPLSRMRSQRGRTVLGIDHIGSAHDDEQLTLLLQAAQSRLHTGRRILPARGRGWWPADRHAGGGGHRLADGTWETLEAVYASLGFDQIADNAFKALVLARIIEPTSKADTVRVKAELGVPGPTRVTFMRCLKRVVERNYRTAIATACYTHATQHGGIALVLYDLTTLHFETDVEDRLRKVGNDEAAAIRPTRSPSGCSPPPPASRWRCTCSKGTRRGPRPWSQVLTTFAERHHISDVVVVADAGMLSAANLFSLEDAGFSFIVGYHPSSAVDDLADHVHRHGNAFRDRQAHRGHPRHGRRDGHPETGGSSMTTSSNGLSTTTGRSTR